MASFQTFFRTVVMLATLGLLAKAWYHYGPTMTEMQAIGARVLQIADQAWTDYWRSSATNPTLANDPRAPILDEAPPRFVPVDGLAQPIAAAPLAASQGASTGPVQLANGIVETSPPAPNPWNGVPAPTSTLTPMESPPEHDPMPALLERLAERGVRDLELKNWGSGGELYRFSCSAPWAASPSYTRHFEAVAASPLAAVEQVAAEFDAWRASQPQSAVPSR